MRRMRVCAVLVVTVSVFPLSSCHDSEQKFWTQYIEACGPSAQLNKNAYFLASNNIGPGSVWGTAGGTANLDALPSAYLGPPNPATQQYAGVNYATSATSCSGTSTRTWDLTLGLPISISNEADLTAALSISNVKTITVSIASVEIDSVPAATWEDAANKLNPTSSEFMDAADGHHFLMSAAEAVTGLTIKYTLNSAVSANVKGNIQAGKTVNIGTAQTPAQAQVDVDTTGQVVTFTAPGKTYVLGQFLRLKPIMVPPSVQNPVIVAQAQNPLALVKHIQVVSDVTAKLQ